jgi:ABC-type Na+ efflux pump permease subunit
MPELHAPPSGAAATSRRDRHMARICAVAWREFKHTALTKAFVIGAVVVPVLMFGVVAAIPLLTAGPKKPIDGTVAVVAADDRVARELQSIFDRIRADPTDTDDDDRVVAETLRSAAPAIAGDPAAMDAAIAAARSAKAQPADVKVMRVPAGGDAAELREGLSNGSYLAIVDLPEGILDAAPADTAMVKVTVPSSSEPNTTELVERQVRNAIVRARVAAAGRDFDSTRALLQRPVVDLVRTTDSGGEAKESIEARMLIPGGFMLLLWVTVFSSANQLLTTTIEEKSSKVMEVLLSAVSPSELLSGKILGQALVSLVMMVMYGGLAVSALAVMTMLDFLPLWLALLFVAYFVMAYFTIAAMMAAAGSAVNDLREVQTLAGPIMTIMVVPLMLWVPIVEHPNGMLATVTSFIPTLTPFIMVVRCAASSDPVPTWQILASLVWGFAVTAGAFWLAARIFRVGVLMQGKPPTPRELLRWAWAR